jgi:hypothetical protein
VVQRPYFTRARIGICKDSGLDLNSVVDHALDLRRAMDRSSFVRRRQCSFDQHCGAGARMHMSYERAGAFPASLSQGDVR